jgi:transposase InsO family protein
MRVSRERIYYTLDTAAEMTTEGKIIVASGQTNRPPKALVRSWLETQDAYTTHDPFRTRFPRNSYMISNVMDLCQADSLAVQNISHYNDNYCYILTEIDDFSKYLHLINLKAKTGSAVAKAFGSILNDYKYLKPFVRRPVMLQTYKSKKFLNKPFRDLLRREGIEHRTFRNPDVKCSMAERIQRTIREKLNK